MLFISMMDDTPNVDALDQRLGRIFEASFEEDVGTKGDSNPRPSAIESITFILTHHAHPFVGVLEPPSLRRESGEGSPTSCYARTCTLENSAFN